jgi:nicotinamidase-related amidase
MLRVATVLLAGAATGVKGFRQTPSFRKFTSSLSMSTKAFSLDSTALVLIEYQNEFCTKGGKLHEAVKDVQESNKVLENSVELVKNAKAKGIKVIHVPISFSDGHPELGKEQYGILAGVKDGEAFLASQWGSEFAPSMKPAEDDIVVSGKRGLCGFQSTNLDFVLRQNGIKTIALGGYLTNCCVESTMRTGYELGYEVVTLTNCCAATSKEGQDAAVTHTFPMFSKPMTSSDFIASLA